MPPVTKHILEAQTENYYYYYYYFIDHTNHRRVGITVGAQHYTHNSLTGINTYIQIRKQCLNYRNIPPTPNT